MYKDLILKCFKSKDYSELEVVAKQDNVMFIHSKDYSKMLAQDVITVTMDGRFYKGKQIIVDDYVPERK